MVGVCVGWAGGEGPDSQKTKMRHYSRHCALVTLQLILFPQLIIIITIMKYHDSRGKRAFLNRPLIVQ